MRWICTLCTVFAILTMVPAAGSHAADHREAPAIQSDPGADVTDVYLFTSPSNPNNVVVIANFYPDAGPDAAFPKRGIQLYFDLDGDAVEDRSFNFKFGKLKRNGSQKVKASLDGSPDSSLNKRLVKGKTTPFDKPANIIDAKQGITAFAGFRDDPFFGDMRAHDGPFVCPPGVDSFAGTNVLSIVLDLPAVVFNPGTTQVPPFAFWVSTKRDSLGAPLTNEMLVPPNKLLSGDPREKDRFNATRPDLQEARFAESVRRTLGVLNDPSTADRLTRDRFPDTLFFDRSLPQGFPNGRQLADDVIDAELALLTGGVERTDCVPGNDVDFLAGFPFLAPPHRE